MPVGLSDGTSYGDSADWFAAAIDNRSEKKRSDQMEINTNSTAGDFQSRFYATDASRMPPEASTELAGALKSYGSMGAPENRSVLEKLTGSDGGERFQTWPERLARSAFTLPGDVLSGKVQPGSIQEIERASDLAGLVVLGPAPVAAKLAEGTLGSFAGVKSKTLPKDKLYEAQSMELDMMHPDDIWDKTGFFRGADSRWRYEIPDKDAKLKPEGFDSVKETMPSGEVVDSVVPKTKTTDFFGSKQNPLTLDKIIDHPELFKAYPELKTMKVEPLPDYLQKSNAKRETNVRGQVMGDTIYLAEGHPEFIKSVLLHEIQHGIQHHEGFAFGSNQEQFLPKEHLQAEKEFLQIKQTAEKDLKDRKVPTVAVKEVLKDEARGVDMKEDLEFLKKKFKMDDQDIQRLRNIVKSEDLIQKAKDEALSKYQRLMGEVEARNVQVRRNYDDAARRISPQRTEDVARFLQHNPK